MKLHNYLAKSVKQYTLVRYKTCATPWQDFYFINCNQKSRFCIYSNIILTDFFSYLMEKRKFIVDPTS